MARRQQLGEAQVAELFDPPTEQRELVRHYTLSETDLSDIRRCRGDHNRLGYALMLCYLRYPGRALRAGERPPPAMLHFVSEQIDVSPDTVDESGSAERSRQRHSIECQDRLGLRPFGKRSAAELTDALLAPAIENDRLATLAELVAANLPRAPHRASIARGTGTALCGTPSPSPPGGASPVPWLVDRATQTPR